MAEKYSKCLIYYIWKMRSGQSNSDTIKLVFNFNQSNADKDYNIDLVNVAGISSNI